MSVVIEYDHSNAKVIGDIHTVAEAQINRILSYAVEGARFSQAFKRRQWDGRTYLFKRIRHGLASVPTGLIGYMLPVFNEFGIDVEFVDKREIPTKQQDIAWTLETDRRYYQTDAVEAALKATRGIWEIATGAGKALTAAYLFHRVGLPGLVIVQSKMAAKDTCDDFKRSLGNVDIGIWSDDKKQVGFITICTVQSILKAAPDSPLYEAYKNAHVTIWDEVHSYGGGEFYKLALMSNSYYKIGMSGTAYRKDSKDILLSACTGRVIYKKKAAELQEEGFLAPSIIQFRRSLPPSHVSAKELIKMEKDELYKQAIVYNMPRNNLLLQILTEFENVSVAISVKLIEHGELLSQMTGIPFLNGKSSKKERDRVRDGLKDGSIQKIIGTSLLDQSVDFPRLKGFINMGGYSPRVAQIQRLGRILRIGDGSTARFIDFTDTWNTQMSRHAKQRISYMKRENFTIEVEHDKGTTASSLLTDIIDDIS